MGLRLITPPVAEPVSLAEVKADLRIDHTDDDVRLARLITEARQSIDGPRTSFMRSLMPQTWELVLDGYPISEIRLPTAPVASITSIKYDDADGVEQTISANDYYLDEASEPPWVVPAATGWPVGTLAAVNAVRVRFVSGYANADAVPGDIKGAIRLKVQQAYDGTDTSKTVWDLLSQWRLFL